jgi:hypothetical protein|tara:strand:- start:1208 stop:1522 length:315 start_codon:yes stop_codon:yes gene_type:complete
MPTYTFFNELAGTEYDEFMSIADMEKLLKEYPHIKRSWGPGSAPALTGDHLMGVGPKNDEGFKDLMKGIASKHPDSPMADKYGNSKSIQRLKSESIINEHRKRK